MDIKFELINTGLFLDDEWLEQYVALMTRNLTTEKEQYKTQRHHIIPRYCYFSKNISVNNSKENIIHLSIIDHVYAHYYLTRCSTTDYSKYANESSIKYICRTDKSIKEILSNLPYYSDMYEEYIKLNSQMQKGKRTKEDNPFYGKHHSEETKAHLKKHHAHLSGENHPNYGKHMSEENKEKNKYCKHG